MPLSPLGYQQEQKPLSPAHRAPTRPSVLVFGASVRAAVESMQRAGCVAWGVDLFADTDALAVAPTIRIARYPQEFLVAADRLPTAPWIYTGGLENNPELLEQLARRSPLLGNSSDVCRRVRDLGSLQAALAVAGAALPEIRSSPPSALDAQWLWKPRRSSGGLGVRRSDGRNDTANSANKCDDRTGYFQRYVDGTPLGAVFVSSPLADLRLAGVARQLSGPTWGEAPEFAYGGSLGPVPLDAARLRQLESLGRALAAEFSLVGLWGLDLIDDGRTLWPLEVNPRYTASVEILERAAGVSWMSAHLQACGLTPPQPAPPDNLALASLSPSSASPLVHGKAIVYASRDLRVDRRLALRLDELHKTGRAADLPSPDSRVPAKTPLCTVFAWGPDESEVLGKLRDLSQELRGDAWKG